jgi:hypothetical protein
MPNPFNFPETKFCPEVDEVLITLAKLKKIVEWSNAYNLKCRLGAAKDDDGNPIPLNYMGHNRYWISMGEGTDETVGPYSLVSVYDLNPSETDTRTLLVRYKITDSQGGIVQTEAQAAKHIRACRLEAERKEAMAKKDPKLNESVNIHMPAIYRPERASKMVERI